MPFYRQTIGGHFYKDYKNGNCKRVSEKEYLKNVRRVKGGVAYVAQKTMNKLPLTLPLLGPSSQNPPSPSSTTIPVQNPPITSPSVSPSSSSLNQSKEKETPPLLSSETIKESPLSSQLESPPQSQPESQQQLPPPELSQKSTLPNKTPPVPPNQGINKKVEPKGTVITKAVSPQKYTCKCSCKKI
jgi:hypothetical protein